MSTPFLNIPIFAFPAAPGGKLHTYQAGGLTPKQTFSDPAGAVINTNPVVLDTNGQAIVRLDTGSYHIVLKDSTDTSTLFDADYVDAIYLTQATLISLLGGNPIQGQTAAEAAAGITPVNYGYSPLDIRRYGGDPTGATASDTALSSAISVCGTQGGTIRLPGGGLSNGGSLYNFASQINLNQKTGIILQGDSGCTGGAAPATRIAYTGTVANPFISMMSAVGIKLRDLQIVHTNAGFTNTYIKCGNDGLGHGDSVFCEISNCVIGSSVGGVGNLHVDLDGCICFTAYNCNFISGNPSIRGMNPVGRGYANVIRFRDCHWATSYVAPVQNGGQAWVFDGCTFEPLVTTNTPAGGLFAPSNAAFNGLKITGCWFGDAGVGVGTWIDIYGQAVEISGNYISGNTTGTTAITLRSSNGWSIVANTFANFLNGINFATATCGQVSVKDCVANNVTNPWVNSGNITLGQLEFGPNFGFGIPAGHGSQGSNGYRVNADGTIEQWGLFSASASSGTVSFNTNGVNFPNAVFNDVQATLSGVGSTANTIYITNQTTSGFTYTIGGTFTNPTTFFWRARGR